MGKGKNDRALSNAARRRRKTRKRKVREHTQRMEELTNRRCSEAVLEIINSTKSSADIVDEYTHGPIIGEGEPFPTWTFLRTMLYPAMMVVGISLMFYLCSK